MFLQLYKLKGTERGLCNCALGEHPPPPPLCLAPQGTCAAVQRMQAQACSGTPSSQDVEQVGDFFAGEVLGNAATPLQCVADHVALAVLQLQDLVLDGACGFSRGDGCAAVG